MSSTSTQFRWPTKTERRAFVAELRRSSRPQAPFELDPRSPLFSRTELRSAVIAVGAVVITLGVGLTVGLLALLA